MQNTTTIKINGRNCGIDMDGNPVIVKREREVVYYRESAIQSIFTDIGTFSTLLISFYINYKFIGGNNFIDVILLVLFFLLISTEADRKKRQFTSWKDLRKFINKEIAKDKKNNA